MLRRPVCAVTWRPGNGPPRNTPSCAGGARRLRPVYRRRATDPAGGRLSMARLLIVEARFYDHLNDLLLEGARSALKGHEVEVMTVPGALEVPAAIARASETGRYDGYVALGVVIRGETYPFQIF